MFKPIYRKKTSFGKRISHIFEYLATVFIGAVINCIPFRFLDNAAHFLILILLPLFPKAKERVKNNIVQYFPEKSPAEINTFIKKNLQNTLRVTLEVFQSWKFRKKEFAEKHIQIENKKSANLLAQRQKGVIAVQGHFGNWELPVPFFHHQKVEISFSAKHLSNPYVDRKLERRRKKYGGKIIYLDQSLQLIKELRKGNVIGLVADQDAGADGVFVDFLGKKASTFAGPAILSYLTGSDIVLATCIFTGKGKYRVNLVRVHFGEKKKEMATKDNKSIQELTQKWSTALETEVKKNPEQYFWIHRRWKTKQGAVDSLQGSDNLIPVN